MVRGSALPGLYQRNILSIRPNQLYGPSDSRPFRVPFRLLPVPISTIDGKYSHYYILRLPGSGSGHGVAFKNSRRGIDHVITPGCRLPFPSEWRSWQYSGVLVWNGAAQRIWQSGLLLIPLAIAILIWVLIYRKNWTFEPKLVRHGYQDHQGAIILDCIDRFHCDHGNCLVYIPALIECVDRLDYQTTSDFGKSRDSLLSRFSRLGP